LNHHLETWRANVCAFQHPAQPLAFGLSPKVSQHHVNARWQTIGTVTWEKVVR
jgi:hypothetical protein